MLFLIGLISGYDLATTLALWLVKLRSAESALKLARLVEIITGAKWKNGLRSLYNGCGEPTGCIDIGGIKM